MNTPKQKDPAQELGYNEQMQQAARDAFSGTLGTPFWAEVARQLESKDEAEKSLVQKRPSK